MTPNGSLSYLHIPAVDLQRSAAFYRDVLGWDVRNADTPRPGFVDPSGHLGGAWVTNQVPAREPGLLPYMYADQIDDTLAAVTAHGGEVVTPVHEEGNVWVATFTDPAGNVLGLWYDGPRGEAAAG